MQGNPMLSYSFISLSVEELGAIQIKSNTETKMYQIVAIIVLTKLSSPFSFLFLSMWHWWLVYFANGMVIIRYSKESNPIHCPLCQSDVKMDYILLCKQLLTLKDKIATALLKRTCQYLPHMVHQRREAIRCGVAYHSIMLISHLSKPPLDFTQHKPPGCSSEDCFLLSFKYS